MKKFILALFMTTTVACATYAMEPVVEDEVIENKNIIQPVADEVKAEVDKELTEAGEKRNNAIKKHGFINRMEGDGLHKNPRFDRAAQRQRRNEKSEEFAQKFRKNAEMKKEGRLIR